MSLQNWKTIQKCKDMALKDLKNLRDIKRVICVSDTGGENNGSTVKDKSKTKFAHFLLRLCVVIPFLKLSLVFSLFGPQLQLTTRVSTSLRQKILLNSPRIVLSLELKFNIIHNS
jgi:hypothetical protein